MKGAKTFIDGHFSKRKNFRDISIIDIDIDGRDDWI